MCAKNRKINKKLKRKVEELSKSCQKVVKTVVKKVVKVVKSCQKVVAPGPGTTLSHLVKMRSCRVLL
jgi:hypothetical protein